MGGDPLHVSDYSRGRSAVRIADRHRFELDKTDLYWREDVEREILQTIAERHETDVLYHVGDDLGCVDDADFLHGLDFTLIRYAIGNNDGVRPEDIHGNGIVSGEKMEWPVNDGEREYRVAMAHSPDEFGTNLEMDRDTGDALKSEEGEFYDLVIMGDGHFSKQHRINPKTVADKAGSIGETYDADGEEMEYFFPDRRMWNEFPDELRREVPPPKRSFAVIRFWRGITIYRYDAEELAEAYHYDNLDIEDVGPESVFYFEPADEDDWDTTVQRLEGDTERPVAMSD